MKNFNLLQIVLGTASAAVVNCRPQIRLLFACALVELGFPTAPFTPSGILNFEEKLFIFLQKHTVMHFCQGTIPILRQHIFGLFLTHPTTLSKHK